MNRWLSRGPRLSLLVWLGWSPQLLHAQTEAFAYQGRLSQSGNLAAGLYDLQFSIWDSANPGGTRVAGPLTNGAVIVSNGLFQVTLDFGGGVFSGQARWLEISVRTNGSSAAYAVLTPRQPLTAAPWATYANRSGLAANLSGGGIFLTN